MTGITLSATEANIERGKELTLTATVAPADATNKAVVFTSDNEKVATVTSEGVVKAVATGSATITATTVNGKSATCKVTVIVPATKVFVNQSLILKKGKTLQLTASVLTADSTDKLTWKSSNTKKVTVSATGKIKAVATGSATITVTSDSGKKATCKVTVVKKAVKATKVTIKKTSKTMNVGDVKQLKVTVKPSKTTDTVTFKSSKKSDSMPEVVSENNQVDNVIGEVCSMMKVSTQIYDRTLVAVLKEDRKALKELVRESKEMYDESHKIKYSLMPALRKMKGSGLELSLYYIQVVDYLNEMAKALVHITKPAFEHIDNNHKGLSQEQTDDLMHINDDVAEIYGNINRMITTNDFSDIDTVLMMRDALFERIVLTTKSELKRINAGEGNTKASMFYLTVMSETKAMVLQARNLLKAQRYFLEHAGGNKYRI